MKSYLYTPYELAQIIYNNNFGIEEYIELLGALHAYDNAFILPEYREDIKKFILAVMDKLEYITSPAEYFSEQLECEKDSEQFGIIGKKESEEDYQNSHFYFKELKIKIKYINSNGLAKKKFSTLLSDFGYKNRGPKIVNYINSCLYFYHIEPSLKGGIPCCIDKVDKDDIIIFRTI